ncbi:hypothetical protein ACWCSH_45455, partial [Streptosporangium sp. NPDC001682]
ERAAVREREYRVTVWSSVVEHHVGEVEQLAARLPAVKAGQVYAWHAEERYSYQGYADVLEKLLADLVKAKKL